MSLYELRLNWTDRQSGRLCEYLTVHFHPDASSSMGERMWVTNSTSFLSPTLLNVVVNSKFVSNKIQRAFYTTYPNESDYNAVVADNIMFHGGDPDCLPGKDAQTKIWAVRVRFGQMNRPDGPVIHENRCIYIKPAGKNIKHYCFGQFIVCNGTCFRY